MKNFNNLTKLALSGICLISLAACSEEDFGFDKNEIAYEKNFIKEFGNPAPNHKWGFDVANYIFKEATDFPSTRAVIKQDMMIGSTNLSATVVYGRPEDISQKEHDEVYAWFSNHRVDWTNSPTWWKAEDGERTTQTSDNIAHVIKTDYKAAGYGSLIGKNPDNVLGNYNINVQIGFFNGWIQHVANDNHHTDEVSIDGTVSYSSANMDYLCFHDLRAKKFGDHLNDFNGATGYGWSDKEGTPQYNGILVTETDFNVCTYGCSAGGSNPHDKYFVVYLEGDGYAGWYLGMDFEADKEGANANERVKADGICNDWIIKISDVGNSVYNPARIMCEDLGGSFDTDFNDIVYDVKYDNPVCIITIQAAGGTMPIELWYGLKDKGGDQLTHNNKSEVHDMLGTKVSEPVNVNASYGKDNLAPISFYLSFNKDKKSYWNGSADVPCIDMSSKTFEFQDINIYVFDEQRAEWLNLNYIDESSVVPCRICVPADTKWCKELKSIKNGYSKFMDWVSDPTIEFWKGPKDTSLLY